MRLLKKLPNKRKTGSEEEEEEEESPRAPNSQQSPKVQMNAPIFPKQTGLENFTKVFCQTLVPNPSPSPFEK
jgi:hypothetical protein